MDTFFRVAPFERLRFVMRAVAQRPTDPIDAAIDALLELQHKRDAARLFFSMWAVATTSKPVRLALHAFYAHWIEVMASVAAPEAAKRVALRRAAGGRVAVSLRRRRLDQSARRRALRTLDLMWRAAPAGKV